MLTSVEPLKTISLSLNIISALCGFLVVIFILIIMRINKKLVDRVSLRFTLAISFFDCLRALALILHSQQRIDGLACIAISFTNHWLTLVYLFLTVAIAFNLQQVFLKGKKFQAQWELYYWGVSLSSATVLLLIPLVFGRLGLDDQFQYCEFKDFKSTETFIWRACSYLIWILFSIIYCTVIVIKVIIHLRQRVSVLEQLSDESGFSLSPAKCAQLQRDLKRLITRISFYCLIPLITQVGYCVSKLYCFLSGAPPAPIFYISTIGLDLPGILNFFAFMLDPAFLVALNSIRNRQISESRTPQNIPFLDSKGPAICHNSVPSLSSRSSTLISVSENFTSQQVERLHEASFIGNTVPMQEFIPSHSHQSSVNPSLYQVPPGTYSANTSVVRFGSINPPPAAASVPNTADILGSLLYQDNQNTCPTQVHSNTRNNQSPISVCKFVQGL